VVDGDSPQESEGDNELTPAPPEQGSGFGELQPHVPAEIRDVAFPSAGRGYERRAVDAYVQRVNRLIAELEVSRSPQGAVRHALDRVGEQTKAILQRAQESAEEITATARGEADEGIARARARANEIVASAMAARVEAEEIVANAKKEAEAILAAAKAEVDVVLARSRTEAGEIVARSRTEAAERRRRFEEDIAASREQAETRMQELHGETEAVWKERHELLDEIHAMATRLLEVATGAAARGSPRGPIEPVEAPTPEPDSGDARELTGVAAKNQAAGRMPMVESPERSDRRTGDENGE
jgi:DivIVA domain-containing protein